MRTSSPSEIRSWARGQGMQVNDRGSLPAAVLEAYAASSSPSKGTKAMAPTTKRTARKTAAPGRKRSPGRTAVAKAPAARAAKRAQPARQAAPAVPAPQVEAPVAGSVDLAGGLRSY